MQKDIEPFLYSSQRLLLRLPQHSADALQLAESLRVHNIPVQYLIGPEDMSLASSAELALPGIIMWESVEHIGIDKYIDPYHRISSGISPYVFPRDLIGYVNSQIYIHPQTATKSIKFLDSLGIKSRVRESAELSEQGLYVTSGELLILPKRPEALVSAYVDKYEKTKHRLNDSLSDDDINEFRYQLQDVEKILDPNMEVDYLPSIAPETQSFNQQLFPLIEGVMGNGHLDMGANIAINSRGRLLAVSYAYYETFTEEVIALANRQQLEIRITDPMAVNFIEIDGQILVPDTFASAIKEYQEVIGNTVIAIPDPWRLEARENSSSPGGPRCRSLVLPVGVQ